MNSLRRGPWFNAVLSEPAVFCGRSRTPSRSRVRRPISRIACSLVIQQFELLPWEKTPRLVHQRFCLISMVYRQSSNTFIQNLGELGLEFLVQAWVVMSQVFRHRCSTPHLSAGQ